MLIRAKRLTSGLNLESPNNDREVVIDHIVSFWVDGDDICFETITGDIYAVFEETKQNFTQALMNNKELK